MMSTSSSGAYTRGRSLPRPPSSGFDMDVNNTLPQPSMALRDRTPSPVRRSPYSGRHGSPGGSPTTPTRTGSTYSHPPLSPSSLGDMKKLNRSSISYLRNLSEMVPSGEDTVYGLGIPVIET